jgi:hypothetical protein
MRGDHVRHHAAGELPNDHSWMRAGVESAGITRPVESCAPTRCASVRKNASIASYGADVVSCARSAGVASGEGATGAVA